MLCTPYTKSMLDTQFRQGPVSLKAQRRRLGPGRRRNVKRQLEEAMRGGLMAEAASGQPASRPLPPGLDLLWGRRERGQRGPRPGLSADTIVEAAVRLGAREGLEG